LAAEQEVFFLGEMDTGPKSAHLIGIVQQQYNL